MNKYKFIAEEEIKKQERIVQDCMRCPKVGCSGLQLLDNSGQLSGIASQYVKMLSAVCDISHCSTPECQICHKGKDSTVYRDGIGFVCADCYEALTQSDAAIIETQPARVLVDQFTPYESASHQQALRARGNPPAARSAPPAAASRYPPPGVYVEPGTYVRQQQVSDEYAEQIASMLRNGVISRGYAEAALGDRALTPEQIRHYASPEPGRPEYRFASFITTESHARWLHSVHIIGRWRIVEPQIKHCYSQQHPRDSEGFWTCRVEAEITDEENSGWQIAFHRGDVGYEEYGYNIEFRWLD